MHVKRPLPRLAAALVAVTLAAAACGGDDTDTDAAATTGDPSATTQSDDTASDTTTSDTDVAAADADDDHDHADHDHDDGDTDHDHDDDTAIALDTDLEIANAAYLADYELADEDFGTMVTVTVADDTRTMMSNSLPNHETGEFPNAGNPNEISEQELVFEFPSTGTFTGAASFAQTPGVALNGVTFEPGTAETATCESGETYRIEAIQDLYDLGLDFNNAHVQPGGQYHYHGVSALLVDAFDSDEDLALVGFAADGFLMVYSKSGAYDSSYVLSEEDRAGTDCLISGPAGTVVDLAGTTPDGTYGSDFDFVDGAGDLDECNGTEIDGEYVYVLTDEYPYIPRCLMGEAAAGPADGGVGGAGPGQGGTAPDLSEAAEALGVTVDELMAILPGPGADLTDAAAELGVTVDELTELLPAPGGQP
ncbi:MAG: YHYH protein [Actinomycetota bacterium]